MCIIGIKITSLSSPLQVTFLSIIGLVLYSFTKSLLHELSAKAKSNKVSILFIVVSSGYIFSKSYLLLRKFYGFYNRLKLKKHIAFSHPWGKQKALRYKQSVIRDILNNIVYIRTSKGKVLHLP